MLRSEVWPAPGTIPRAVPVRARLPAGPLGELDDPPPPGDFDISMVKDSVYFFS